VANGHAINRDSNSDDDGGGGGGGDGRPLSNVRR